MSNVVSQGKCPHCPSSDAFTTYIDGSTYCFSCQAHSPPAGYNYRITPKQVTFNEEWLNWEDYKRVPVNGINCPANWWWLKQYLNDEEIAEYFKFVPAVNRHVFQHGDYAEYRSISTPPKTISRGEKPIVTFGNKLPFILVEDVVSAIKVGRQYCGIPLFGCTLPIGMTKFGDDVVLWLDADKYTTAIRVARRLRAICLNVYVVKTREDPKALSNEEIKRVIEEKVNETVG